MKIERTAAIGTIATILLVASTAALAQGNVDLPRYPSVSPDGEQVVFSWRGDLWKVSTDGGHAERLTANPADELRSDWSPDGQRLAFESDRDGFRNLYLMNADGTGVRRVSNVDRSLSLSGFGVDDEGEEVLLLDAALEGDVYRGTRPYMISTEGGMLRRVHGAFGEHPTCSPDGDVVAFTRGGSSWSRRHYRGSDDRDVWLHHRDAGTFTRLTRWTGNDGKAKWAGPRTLLFLSDREDRCVNLYRMSADDGGQSARRLTDFTDTDIWDYDVSADGSTAVFVQWDTLYRLDLDDANATPAALTITASEDERDNYELLSIDRRVDEAALSPDGQVMAMIAYGEVYVRNVDEGSPTRRVTDSHAHEHGIAWSPDGERLYFVSDRDGTESIYAATVALTREEIKEAYRTATSPPAPEVEEEAQPDAPEPDADQDEGNEHADEDGGQEEDDADDDGEAEKEEEETPAKRWHDAWRFEIHDVVVAETNDRDPQPSPDGKSLSFRRSRGDIVIRDLETGTERVLVTGWDFGISWRWSPNSEFIAYQQDDRDFNSDIWVVLSDGSAPPVNISRHPDSDANPRWSADSRILSFVSERVNEEYDVWSVYLDRDIESLPDIDLQKYYEERADAVKKRKPLGPKSESPESIVDELELDDAYLRLRRVTSMNGSEFNNEITPAGDRYVFSSGGDLYTVKWDGSDQKKIADRGDVQHLSLKGDKVVLVTGGRAATVGIDGGKTETIDISDRIRIDLQKQASQKFHEAARILGEVFYHPTMKDLDWAALTREYHELAVQSRTADEFNDVAARLLGELNASHLGVRAPGRNEPDSQSHGRLGVDYERVGNGFRITHVVPRSPAAVGEMALQPGDVITAIEFEPIGPADTLESRLEGRVNDETTFTITRSTDDGESLELEVLLTPVSYGAARQLRYDEWQRGNARKVHEWSDGRIGYLHIRGMNIPSLFEFERDLFAAAHGREGLLVDVRNNGGGHTADYVLGSLMVRPHAYTVPRGADPSHTDGYPQDRLFIQRYTRPVNMLCNEKSFSNAEIVSHAFKTLDRGNLVGQETYGGVISTGGTRLLDGTFVRLPFRGWYLPDGTDMENNGAVPDILVEQTPEDESEKYDRQLKAAVDDLLERLE